MPSPFPQARPGDGRYAIFRPFGRRSSHSCIVQHLLGIDDYGCPLPQPADTAVMTRSHIAHIEAGRRTPSKEDARRLDQALNGKRAE